MFLAFTGFARSGKDTSVKYLVENHGYLRVSIAEPVYNILYAMNPVINSYHDGRRIKSVRVKELVDFQGWEATKTANEEVRELLQRLAVEGIRTELGEGTLLDRAIHKASQRNFTNVAFSDLRFPEESTKVRSYGGKVIRVTRPGVKSVNSHISDKVIPDEFVDYEVANDGTIQDLEHKIRVLLGLRPASTQS